MVCHSMSQLASCDVIWRHGVTSHDVMLWRHMTSQHKPYWLYIEFLRLKPENCIFLSRDLGLWPMTLPIKLDLDMVRADLHVKYFVCTSNGSVVRVHTHTHTHRSDSITSAADAGGNKGRPRYPPRPGRITGQSLTWAGFEPRTLEFARADHSNLSNALDHSAILSGPKGQKVVYRDRWFMVMVMVLFLIFGCSRFCCRPLNFVFLFYS